VEVAAIQHAKKRTTARNIATEPTAESGKRRNRSKGTTSALSFERGPK
jgi:hypothetical protein